MDELQYPGCYVRAVIGSRGCHKRLQVTGEERCHITQRSEKTNRTSHRGVRERVLLKLSRSCKLGSFTVSLPYECRGNWYQLDLKNCTTAAPALKLRPNFVLSDLQRVSDTAHCAPLLSLNKSASAWVALFSRFFHSDSILHTYLQVNKWLPHYVVFFSYESHWILLERDDSKRYNANLSYAWNYYLIHQVSHL